MRTVKGVLIHEHGDSVSVLGEGPDSGKFRISASDVVRRFALMDSHDTLGETWIAEVKLVDGLVPWLKANDSQPVIISPNGWELDGSQHLTREPAL